MSLTAFDGEERVDQLLCGRRAEHWRNEIPRLVDDLATRHRVANRSTHRLHLLGEVRPVGKRDLDDGDTHRKQPVQRGVGV